MPNWISKTPPNGGSNDKVYVDPQSESKHRSYKPGYFYDGNECKPVTEMVSAQGSWGHAANQGFVRFSPDVEIDTGFIGQGKLEGMKSQGSLSRKGNEKTKNPTPKRY